MARDIGKMIRFLRGEEEIDKYKKRNLGLIDLPFNVEKAKVFGRLQSLTVFIKNNREEWDVKTYEYYKMLLEKVRAKYNSL